MEPKTEQDRAKMAAGAQAVETYCRDGMRLGLGSGTTSHWFVRALAEKVHAGLDVVGVPTSNATRKLAAELGVRLADFDQVPQLDVTIDGPDEIDRHGRMIKGGGACLLWEKIVARASAKMVVVADDTKVVHQLGLFPLPIEVVRFGRVSTERLINELLEDFGYDNIHITYRMRNGRLLLTDSGNHILDAPLFAISKPEELARRLNEIPGVVENGLFVGIAQEIVVGHANGTTEVLRLPMANSGREPAGYRGGEA